jgi:hypothetical protein
MPLTYNRLLLAKVETTYNTSAAPTGTDAFLVGNDLSLQPLQMELVERDLLYPFLGNRSRLPTQRLAGISFSFELAGSGTAGIAPKPGLFLRASGYGETIVPATSVTYAPIGSSYEGITIDCRYDGKKHLITGVRGTVEFEGQANQVGRGKFSGLGFYATPTDTANPSQTFSHQASPAIINSDNTTPVSVHNYGACMQSFSFKAGRSPKLHQRAGCSKQIRIDTERNPEGEIVIESPTITQKDYFSAAANQTLAGISFTHGATAGNIVAFNFNNCSLGDPEYEDSDGVEMLKLSFMPIPSATNGYDDHTIVFT